ncbi:hypothetical protein QR98_0030640 [Sarcoptes scabiei]|uniref:Ion transport N-terminal domain-containing protein n=1 Tax=Sarcoptes scabiei TaxID=52283 RepID=A0A132A103_SARSC|nr:hypothetical protein QR98_0030640 [Sarcoptes scabiei]
MKLFGSKKALMNERMRQKESGLFIIHPCSTFRNKTLLIIIVVMLLLIFFALATEKKICTHYVQNENATINGTY